MNYFKLLAGFACLLFLSAPIQSQKARIFTIHEDRVKPHSIGEYEMAAKNLVAACEKHNIKDMSWMAVSTDDMRYLYVGEIQSMAELDKDQFSSLVDKMGADAFGEMMSGFKGYEEHADYTIQLREDLSYQPTGIDQRTEGQEYRKFSLYYINPADLNEAEKLGKEIMKYHADHRSTLYYRVYQSHFGQMGPYLQVAASGKSPEEYAQRRADMMKKLGPEYGKLVGKIAKMSWKVEYYEGWIRPELSYFPQ